MSANPSRPCRAALVMVAVGAVVWLSASGCGGSNRSEVVVYAAQDQVYAEPILQRFTEETGIRVRAVHDSEAVKTVGLVKRLLAERERPQCDVFWNNEELRTRQLAARGIVRSNDWTRFGYRTRRLVINTNALGLEEAPRNLIELTNAQWRGRVALAYPLFGSTATHFLALRAHWGEERWLAWCEALAANDPFLLDGNSVVVRWVGRGEAAVGLTDSDDIAAGLRAGLPLMAVPFDSNMLVLPNSVAIVTGAPRESQARALLDFLSAPSTVAALVEAGALEGAAMDEMSRQGLPVDWKQLLQSLEPATEQLQQIFLR